MVLPTVALHHARLRVNVGDAERLARKLSAAAHDLLAPLLDVAAQLRAANLGATQLWTGDAVAATAHLQEALALASEHRHEQIALDCLAQLAVVNVLRGELNRAEERSTQAVELAEQRGWCEGPAAACAHLAAAAGAYQRGEFERAESLLARAASAADDRRDACAARHRAAPGAHARRRGAALGRPRRAEAERDPRRAGRRRARAGASWGVALEDAEPRVLMAAGEVEQAAQTLAGARERAPTASSLLVRQASLELHEASRSWRPSRSRGRSPSRGPPAPRWLLPPTRRYSLEGWLLQALADHAAGDHHAASEALDRALALAEREPFRDAFLLNGPEVRELLELQAQSGTAHPALLEVLLDGVGQHNPCRRHAARAADRARAADPALPADDAHQRRDRGRGVRVAEHRQDPPAQHLPQARRLRARRRGGAGAPARPAPLGDQAPAGRAAGLRGGRVRTLPPGEIEVWREPPPVVPA